jgi:Flp pilus assembly protein TadD
MRLSHFFIDRPIFASVVAIILTLVGAISMARAIDDPELSEQILANAAAALKDRIPHDRE